MNDFFNSGAPVITASAPGRLDVMGGIADYSGSLLLQMPIRERTTVRLQRSTDGQIRIRTKLGRGVKEFQIPTNELEGLSVEAVAAFLKNKPGGDWASYVIGCIVVLHKEKQIPLEGLSVEIASRVPPGKGVSSSAALEVATCCALQKIYALQLKPTELPLLAQKAENDVVLAPCGLMDQLSSYLGEKNRLLPIICQPHEIYPSLKIPTGMRFLAIDSGIRHAVSGASYSEVRAAAFMGYTIIARSLGVSLNELQQARQTGTATNLPFKGYLANISLAEFNAKFLHLLPQRMYGAAFLNDFGVSIDKITQVDPDKYYAIQDCTRHPVEEQFRIGMFRQLLENFPRHTDKEAALALLGELMLQSHVGYTRVGLGNDHTDALVQMARDAGAGAGVYGARVTGGGSGGTVVLLCYGKKGKEAAQSIWKQYNRYYGMHTRFFQGSSDGAAGNSQ